MLKRTLPCSMLPSAAVSSVMMHTLHEHMSHDVDDRITLHASIHASGIQSEAGCAQ